LTLIENALTWASENRDLRRDLATTLRRTGEALSADNKLDDAEKNYRAAIKTLTELAQQDLNDAIIQSNLASTYRAIASIEVRRGELDKALAEYQMAFAIQERLMGLDPGNVSLRVSLASLYAEVAGVLRKQHEFERALELYRKAYVLRRELALSTNSPRLINLAISAISVAEVLQDQNKSLDEAVNLYRQAIEILDEARPRYDSRVFNSYTAIGNILMLRDDRESALKEYKLALGVAQRQVSGDQTSLVWQRNLVSSYVKIGDLLAAQLDKTEALVHYRKALEIATALAAKYPAGEWSTLAESLKAKIQNLA
jgi:tetratricopeptide (TPR) repeat protein